jgi:hypothetical protein
MPQLLVAKLRRKVSAAWNFGASNSGDSATVRSMLPALKQPTAAWTPEIIRRLRDYVESSIVTAASRADFNHIDRRGQHGLSPTLH